MRPRDLPSKWKKILPWYYTEASEPARKQARKKAIKQDVRDNE